MRILGVSDIHGRIEAVMRLRALEANRFDALVVAGDIGSGLESATAVLEILASFGCPVLYVFGNHDCDLPYDLQFGDGCRHLHGRVIELGGYAFAGYSGLPAHWGLNPYAMAADSEVDRRHATTLAIIAELEAAQAEALGRLRELHSDPLSELDNGWPTKRKPTQKDRDRREDLRRREEVRICGPLHAAFAGRPYAAYKRDAEVAYHFVLERNRAQLSELVVGRDPRSVVVVTHERQTSTSRDMPGVALFVFGHRHGYADTRHRGSRFVNVSALDQTVTMMPAGSQGGPGFLTSLRRADLGSYAILELSRNSEVVAMRQCLYADPEGWEPCRDLQIQAPMIGQGDPISCDPR